jgi:flagellar hook-associated protein 3 FlgL
MRISTNTLFDQGISAIQRQQSDLLHTQQQLSTGKRILTPSDDPVAAARVLEVSQSLSTTQQHSANAGTASDALSLEEGVLGNVTNLIQDVRTVLVNAGNTTLNNSDRASLATELRGRYQELLGLANSTDGNGHFLFSGYQGQTTPFTETTPGNVAYNGDQGQRLLQISPSRQIAISDSGSDIFQRIKTGNGTLATAAASGNAGTGVVSEATVTNAADPNLKQPITITFTSATTFDVTGTGPGLPATGVAYTSGNAISYNGWTANITGAPAAGDTFTVQASTNQSLFKTLNDAITLLQTPITGGPGNASLTNGLSAALQNVDNGLNNVLTVRASVGARMRETDAVKNAGDGLVLQYQQVISQLQDVDYAKAISQLTQQQVSLEAAQKSYLNVTGLSLFNYLT